MSDGSATATDAELEQILLDPQITLGVLVGGKDRRPVLVDEVLRVARLHVADVDGLEERLDAYVAQVGGSRVRPVSLDNLCRRGLRRLFGRSNPPARDLYEIPLGFYRQRGILPPTLLSRVTASAKRP